VTVDVVHQRTLERRCNVVSTDGGVSSVEVGVIANNLPTVIGVQA
jgi:hypothetical protein